MTCNNSNMLKAKDAKNDEFYTLMEDIQSELSHYTNQFKGKVIYCNCDKPSASNFYKYFKNNFDKLGIKKLISTYYSKTTHPYVTTYNGKITTKKQLKGNGSFDSPECLKILQQSDIIVTNPPFSLFRAFIHTLVSHKKKFLILGNYNAVAGSEVFPLFVAGKIKLGYDIGSKDFLTPKGTLQSFGNIVWYTNMRVNARRNLDLSATYKKKDYPQCNNCNSINVDRLKDIPKNYKKEMAVPITYLMYHNPSQFKIDGTSSCKLGKKETYARILIRKK